MANPWAIARSTHFCGEYGSRKAAIKAGLVEFGGDPFFIGELQQPAPISRGIDARYLVEQCIETLEEDYCLDIPATDEWPDATPEQYKDLQDRLGAVLDAWVQDHQLSPRWFVVVNVERIDPKAMAMDVVMSDVLTAQGD